MTNERAVIAILTGANHPQVATKLHYIVLLLSFMMAGCTTLQTIDMNAETLHQKIRSGELVRSGDTIRAITLDGVAHLIKVTEVNDNVIIGHTPGGITDGTFIKLPIDDIVRLEVREFSGEHAKEFAKGAGTGGLGTIALLVLATLIGVLISG